MKALKFNLSGETAFFKKPDVNTYIYFTYGQIHKIALLGILGSCLGLKGYNQQQKEDKYPEFYDKLQDLKIAIVPKSSHNGFIRKKVQTFNNSTMFCNKGSDKFGANLIINEQWLEKPSWDIYVLLEENEVCAQLEHNFKNRVFKYIPYLGKNDHFANINNVEVIENIKKADNITKIDSMFKRDVVEFMEIDDSYDGTSYEDEELDFKYQEKLPYKLDELTNQYILDTFIYSNMRVSVLDDSCIYRIKHLNICFI